MRVAERRAPARSPAGPSPGVGITLLLTALGAACSGGGGGGSTGEDGGGFAPTVADGTTVALLETPVQVSDAFVLHGTFPIPPGTFPRTDGLDPFTVLDHDGAPVPTQTEIVSRYPAETDGADVVEVIARVHVPPGATPGTRVRYAVVQEPRTPPADPGDASLDDLVAGPAFVPPAVSDLLADPQGIEITTYDCFGNPYRFHPLDGSGRMRLERFGIARTELRVYGNLAPDPFVAGPQGTLPHSLGVHAYLSTFTDEEYLGLDLRFHNGHSGRDRSTDQDDPLDLLYFSGIDVSLPPGWELIQDFDDPLFGFPRDVDGRRVYSLVAPNADGTMHVIRWQGQFLRRLAIATEAGADRARERFLGAGQAFCLPERDPQDGREYWSWWNRGTSRYFPQDYALPTLDHIGLGDVRDQLRASHDSLVQLLKDGSNLPDYPVPSPSLGWGHPYGIPYGGGTGGNEIFLFDGVSTAAAASVRGLRTYQALHRMHTDRQPTAFYDLDGEPTSVERWLVHVDGQHDYVPFTHFLHPALDPGDPFGFDQAPRFQIDFVRANGLAPSYESQHLAYDPHDYQHFIRYTRAPKVLTWLANDSLAKDDLRMQAEDFNLSYHQYFNNPNGGYQSSGMRAAIEFVQAHRRNGFPFGRGESWGFDCALAAYATSSPEWRATKLPWFEKLVELLAGGQTHCRGFIQAMVSNKFVGGKYRARQAIEASITENMLQGLRETVFRRADDVHAATVRTILARALSSSISKMAWFEGEPAPWTHIGLGPPDPSRSTWCSRLQMPDDAYTPAYERYLLWSSLAYGFELTGDGAFLGKARLVAGNADLLRFLENQGTDNLENRAALLSLMQHLEPAPPQ